MNAFKRLCMATVISAVIAAAYFAGVQSKVTKAAPKDELPPAPSAKATPPSPTAILLGEASVPPEMLRGAEPAPSPDLIVPDLKK